MTEEHARLRRRRKAVADRVRAKLREVLDIEGEHGGLAARGLTGTHARREVAAWRLLYKEAVFELGTALVEASKVGLSIDAILKEPKHKEEEP